MIGALEILHDPEPEQRDHGQLVFYLHLKLPDEPCGEGQYGRISRDVDDSIAVEQGALCI